MKEIIKTRRDFSLLRREVFAGGMLILGVAAFTQMMLMVKEFGGVEISPLELTTAMFSEVWIMWPMVLLFIIGMRLAAVSRARYSRYLAGLSREQLAVLGWLEKNKDDRIAVGDISAECRDRELDLFSEGKETLGQKRFLEGIIRRLGMTDEEKNALSDLVKKYPIWLNYDNRISSKDNCDVGLFEEWKNHGMLGKSYQAHREMESKIMAIAMKPYIQDNSCASQP